MSKGEFILKSIGFVKRNNEEILLQLYEEYIPALQQLEHFSHVNVLWWANKYDNEKSRNLLQCIPPYGENPPITGVFATRAEYRPNPIALTTAKIIEINHEEGILKLQNLDAYDNTPVLDLKAYFPVCDRVKNAKIPNWIKGWPEWLPEEGLGL